MGVIQCSIPGTKYYIMMRVDICITGMHKHIFLTPYGQLIDAEISFVILVTNIFINNTLYVKKNLSRRTFNDIYI